MTNFGYMGKILFVNLTTREIKKEPLPFELVKDFVGDFGISVKLAYDLIKSQTDPLSPENVILIGAGPFAGTGVPGPSRTNCVTKFPMFAHNRFRMWKYVFLQQTQMGRI